MLPPPDKAVEGLALRRGGLKRGTSKLSWIDRVLLRRVAFPIISRAMRKRHIRYYQYYQEQDILLAFHGMSKHSLRYLDGLPPRVPWLDLVSSLPIDAGVVFDVGGFYGFTGGHFARRAAQVFVFEPAPDNISVIREHNRIRSIANVELVPAAVSDRNGSATFHLKHVHAHHSLGDIGASATADTLSVATLTLDGFARERGIERVALLKIDVEGFEPEVLRGAAGLLAEKRIDAVLFEWSPRFYRQRGIEPDLPLAILRQHGYRVTGLGGDEFVYDPHDRTQIDLLATPL